MPNKHTFGKCSCTCIVCIGFTLGDDAIANVAANVAPSHALQQPHSLVLGQVLCPVAEQMSLRLETIVN